MHAPTTQTHPIIEVINASTQPRPQPESIAVGVAAAKAVVPQRAFIFDFLRTSSHIERSYLRVGYSTQFNPQLSLIPTEDAELDPKDCVGAEEEDDGDEEEEDRSEEEERVGLENEQCGDGEKTEEIGADAGKKATSASAAASRSASSKKEEARQRLAVVGVAAPAPYDASTFRHRALFSMSPAERPPGVARSMVSGRELTELEALARKHAEEMQMLIPPIIEALRNVMNNHDAVAQTIVKDDRFDCFNTVSAVVTSLQEYVARLSEWCYVSPSTFILACIFLDRLLFRYPRLLFTRQNIYKYYGVALRIANKCVDVKNISNKNYAHVIGVSNIHLNDLEAKLLMDIRFGLYVSPAEFFWYARRLVPYHPAVQRLLSITGPTMEMVNTALDLANKQSTCRAWRPVVVEQPAVVAAQNTQRRLTALQSRGTMAAIAASGGVHVHPATAGGSALASQAAYLPSNGFASTTSIGTAYGCVNNNSKASIHQLPHQQQTATFDPIEPAPSNAPVAVLSAFQSEQH